MANVRGIDECCASTLCHEEDDEFNNTNTRENKTASDEQYL
jgi:hypothetical protein